MPSLGDSSPSRRTANAYPRFSGNSMQQLAQLGAIVIVVFLLHNVFFHDYRAEQIQHLTAAGKSMEEIRSLVPPTPRERQKTFVQNANDLEQLKSDVTMLKLEIQTLLRRLEETDEHQGSHHKRMDVEDEGQSLEKIRFQEEENSEKDVVKNIPAKVIDAKPTQTRLELSQLGEVPEGDLLSGG